MKKVLVSLALLCLCKTLFAQQPYIYTIKADSVKITNTCDTAELIIENHTQNVSGFLFNKGKGRTEFRRGLLKINDSIYTVGGDTLRMNPWLQGGNRFGTTGKFGTLDNYDIDFYTNNTHRGRWSTNGNFIIGSTGDEGQKFQVRGTAGVSINPNLSREGDRIMIGGYNNQGDGQNFLFRTSSDYGATYKNILMERDGYIGLGFNAPHSWGVGNPLVRCYPDGQLSIMTSLLSFGNTGGPWNASALITAVSNTNEWLTGQTEYPNGQNHYYFGTRLTGNFDGAKRAPLWISGRTLNFYTGATDVEALTITEAQNVLIGSPTEDGTKLQLAGNFHQMYGGTAEFGNGLLFNVIGGTSRVFSGQEIRYQSNNTGDQHLFKNDIGVAFTGTLVTIDPGTYPALPDNQLSLNVYGKNFTQGLAVNMAGRVGIGITTPTAQLHTTSTVRFSGLTGNDSLSRILVSDAVGNLYYRDASSLAVNETINSDLAVNGRVSAQKMLITQTGRWPDYVFKKQYQLPSLFEVENFIKQNNHLPGVPSAAEVEKKGIDVGGNQAVLLKKIEELTLYVIEQEKKLQKQNEEITELKKQNKEVLELKKQSQELDLLKKQMVELMTLIKGK